MTPTELTTSNIPLAYYWAKKKSLPRPELFDDLLSEAMLGLWHAANSFNKNKGVKFSTYASWCIINEITGYFKKRLRYLDRYTNKFNFHSYYKKEVEEKEFDIKKYASLFIDASDVEYKILDLLEKGLTYSEIGKKIGVSKQRVGQIIKNIRNKYERPSSSNCGISNATTTNSSRTCS